MANPCFIHLVPFVGVYATVDADVYPSISHFRWYKKFSSFSRDRINVFRLLSAPVLSRGKTISLHKTVADFHGLKWLKIIHSNGDGLDNRLANLIPEFSILEVERRANAIRSYQKEKAIRDYWAKNNDS